MWPLEDNIVEFINFQDFILNDDIENIEGMLPTWTNQITTYQTGISNQEVASQEMSNQEMESQEMSNQEMASQEDNTICKKPLGRPRKLLSKSLKIERRKAANKREKKRMHLLTE